MKVSKNHINCIYLKSPLAVNHLWEVRHVIQEKSGEKKWSTIDNNTFHRWSNVNTSAIDNGSRKTNQKIADIIKDTALTAVQLADQKALLMLLLESYLNVFSNNKRSNT